MEMKNKKGRKEVRGKDKLNETLYKPILLVGDAIT